MLTFRRLPLVVVSFITVLSPAGFGNRILNTVPLRLDAQADYSKSWLCADTTEAALHGIYGSSIPVGNRLSVMVDLVNQSNIAQTGTFEFLVAAGGMIAEMYCGYGPGIAYVFQSTLVLCPNAVMGGGGHHGVTYNTSGPTSNVPAPISWSLLPHERKTLSGELWSTGFYGSTSTTGCVVAGMRFNPTFKIVITEDKGAVTGALTYMFSGITTSGTTTACSGKSYSAAWDGCRNPSTTPPLPLPLNGGRPF